MKSHDEHGNGTSTTSSERFTTQVIDGSPYIQPINENGGTEKDDGVASENEFGPPNEKENRLGKVKRRRRRLALAFIGVCLLFALALALFLYRRMPTRVEYGSSKQTEVLPPAPGTNKGVQDSRTEKAIAEAQRLTEKNVRGELDGPQTDLTPKQDSPFSFPSDSGTPSMGSEQTKDSTVLNDSQTSNTDSAERQSSQPTTLKSQRNSESSLYIVEPPSQVSANPTSNKSLIPTPRKDEVKAEPIVLPTFGTMLPVETIGSLYTLRAGALVRMQLTRDVSANGWSMKRGTVLVGSTKGSDLDRAIVSLVGFIDPHTNKLVRLEGDLLGGDGALGLKGKRRRIDAGWTRVLSRLVTAGAEIAGAFLSGRDRDTVIISDGVRTRTVNPITEEISGVLGSELERDKSRSFVEVSAGTPGYVLVTELPSQIEGATSIPASDDSLSSLTNVETPRPSTGLSERELADLLANGSREQIMAAMPRMSPEMRKIAEAVLRP